MIFAVIFCGVAEKLQRPRAVPGSNGEIFLFGKS